MYLSVVLLVIILTLLLLLTVFHYTTSARKYWLHRNVPYREPCPLFGNFGATFTMKRSYSKMLEYFYTSFRHEKFVGLFQARRPTLMLIDLDVIKSVMSTEFSCFNDRIMVTTDTKREPLLRNLANMSGAEWRAMRHVVTPTFSSAKMKAMFPLVTECSETLRQVLLQQPLDEVDVGSLMSRFTTDVIGSCAFGVDPGSLKDPNSPFHKMSQRMFKTSRSAILKRYCRAFFPRLFKLLNLRTYSPDVEVFFTSIISQVLEERRRNKTDRKDFLQLMLNVQSTEKEVTMTDALITSNSFIFMLAGLESTATNLSFCLYELAKNQDLQAAIREEILSCLGSHGGLSYEAVSAMRLTTQAVLETLRLHPSNPITTRMCTAPCTLPGTRLTLQPRENILIPLICVQRDPSLFPEPDKFDPDRFKDDVSPPGFLAFGEGPRSCPAGRFAQLMALAGLAAILSEFTVEPCAKTTPTIEYDPRSVMLKNKGGIWLRFSRLKKTSANV
ncbi:cytochrome P450 6a2-like [Plutella xylostella]|uniref:cytochrome P450 6a2-like n=1 Tax=Plutella xylostella TaxID=51655 RepID=UPI00203284EF|nr:cytochrome P450 6a2-like [Plutella xylostella]